MSEEPLCKICLRSKQKRLELLVDFLVWKKKKQLLYKLGDITENQEYSTIFPNPLSSHPPISLT